MDGCNRRILLAAGLLSLGLALLGSAQACGRAKAEPLEVTYYYLPG